MTTRLAAAAAATVVAGTVGFAATGGSAAVIQPTGSAELTARSAAPEDLEDRARADRASRRTRPPAVRRTGTVPTPKTTAKTRPVTPTPTQTRTRTQTPKPASPTSTTPKPKPVSGWVLPTKGYTVTSGFGQRWGTLHAGVDLAAPSGTPVYAARSGTVSLARWYGGYGYAVIVKHGDGVSTLYGHNSKLLVSAGQQVSAGQRISLIGSTGDSTGPHLHFEVQINGDPVDPVPYLRERGVRI